MFKFKWPRSESILNIVQTVALIATLIFTIESDHVQANRDSADFMLKFDQRLYEGPGGLIARTLDREGKLDKLKLDQAHLDDALADFFGHYELLYEAYTHQMMDEDMAYDAFENDLAKALNDTKARKFLMEALDENEDFYAGIFELAKKWDIKFSPVTKLHPNDR